MKNHRTVAFAFTLFLAAALPVEGIPDLRFSKVAGSLVLYADDKRQDLFYYPPGDLVLATDAEGKPDLHFLLTRYTGNVTGADRGSILHRSLLSLRIKMPGPTQTEVRAARESLIASGFRRNPELRPLPIRRLEAALVYTSLSEPTAPQTASEGHFEPGQAEGTGTNTGYWSERFYTLGLDANSAQLFWEALQKGQLVISVGYAFYATGLPPDQPVEKLTGSPELVAELQRQIEKRRAADGAAAPGTPTDHLVRAGATGITVDAKKWPNLFRRVDINETIPPGYAALDVYCYDFNNSLRPALHEKRIEIEAEGIGGRRVTLTTMFRRAEPDLYARSLRFPVAVRLDRPYRYRVTEVLQDGKTTVIPWRVSPSWVQLLDVTSSPERAPTDPAARPNSGGRL